MDIIITQWALDSYLELVRKSVFNSTEYKNEIRPKVLLLKSYSLNNPDFKNDKFWSSAGIGPKGFKMKWHNLGNGRIQLRLPVGIILYAYLCEAYVKSNISVEKRMLLKFKAHLQMIEKGCYVERGKLQ